MARFKQVQTGVEFSVDDSKADRYAGELYERVDEQPAKAPAKRSTAKTDSK